MEIAARTQNTQPNATQDNGSAGINLLGDSNSPSYDAAVLTFTLTPLLDGTVSWEYVL